MAITTSITRNLDNNYVQVEVNSPRATTTFYKVPKNKADEFCTQYKKLEKKNTKTYNIAFFSSIGAVCLLMSILTKRFESTMPKLLLSIVGGIFAGYTADSAVRTYLLPKQEKFLKSFDAKEIFYEDKKSPLNQIK